MVGRAICALVGAAVLSISSFASADIVLTQISAFPAPQTGQPDFVYQTNVSSPTIPEFGSGPGAIGNGDGTLPTNLQTAPGLEAISAYPVVAPGSDPSDTIFYDTTLLLTGLAAVGNAQQTTLPFGVEDSQSLGAGGFQLWSTTPLVGGSPSTEVLLLSGTISSATIAGTDGGTDGATFSAPGGVTYTGGLLLTALLVNHGLATGGDISFSMVGVTPPFGINGVTNQLNQFSANATGILDIMAVPEPTCLGILGVGSLLLMRRTRSKSPR